jgi:beta-phosphoglucomutase-like phosphatase (HAD superfamily)
MENSVKLNKVKIIALDFDGVVTNLNIDWKSAIRLASAIAGYDVKSLLTFFDASEGKPIFQTVSREIEKLELEALKNAELTPVVKDFFQKISEMHIDVYIVSMQSAAVVKKFLSDHGLTGYIKDVITRETCPSKKAQVACQLDNSGVRPDEVLLVDDLARNISKCRELGVKCFHFARKQNSRKTREMWNSILNIVVGQTP